MNSAGSDWPAAETLGTAAHQDLNADEREAQQDARDEQQAGRSQDFGKQCRERRTGQRTAASARRDEAEETLSLAGPEQVGHQAPEQGHDEQVENADPYEERPGNGARRAAGRKQGVETEDAGDQEEIAPGNELPPREARGGVAEDGDDGQHGEEGRGKQPRQVFDTALDAHFVTDRAQHVIAAEQAKETRKRPERSPEFPGFCVGQAAQSADHRGMLAAASGKKSHLPLASLLLMGGVHGWN